MLLSRKRGSDPIVSIKRYKTYRRFPAHAGVILLYQLKYVRMDQLLPAHAGWAPLEASFLCKKITLKGLMF